MIIHSQFGLALPLSISLSYLQTRTFNGRGYVMEESINGDVGLIKAWKADPFGNLVFRGTARNFNPDCARAARYVIAEVCISEHSK